VTANRRGDLCCAWFVERSASTIFGVVGFCDVSALSQLLERLRNVQPPPGAAAAVVGVPSAGDELAREVEFLFAQLDEIGQRGELVVSSARSEAAEVEAAAGVQRRRLLEEARAEGERQAAELLSARRAAAEQRVHAMLADAEREAQLVLARGRERTPALVREIVERVLAGPE
jgi:vacuolar-type H+-ATPase subunit H